MSAPARPGIYVHVPFCAHRCGYCDFAVLTGADAPAERRYLDAVRAEVAQLAAAGPASVAPPGSTPGRSWPSFGSVFVGGGTPTRLPAADLAGLVGHVRAVLPVAADAEVSVEANPEDVDEDYLTTVAAVGVNRLSVGAQSFAPHVLAFLDRRHGLHAPLRAVSAARAAGLASVSLDLIYGAPAESDADWRASLAAAVDAGVDHVSCYALTLEPNTVYARRVRRGEQRAPDDDVAAERMATADAVLAGAGLARYEVSNWARPGHESRHNRGYWTGGDYLGVGLAAHGHWRGAAGDAGRGGSARRWWNLRSLDRYVGAVTRGEAPVAGHEILDAGARRAERLMLGLRLTEGVARGDVEPVDEAAAASLRAAGLLVDDGERLTLTAAGLPLAGEATVRLLAARGG